MSLTLTDNINYQRYLIKENLKECLELNQILRQTIDRRMYDREKVVDGRVELLRSGLEILSLSINKLDEQLTELLAQEKKRK